MNRAAIEAAADRLARVLRPRLPARTGFVLLVFDTPGKTSDAPGWLAYASSVAKEGGAAVVEGLFARWRQMGRAEPAPLDVDDLAKTMLLEAGHSVHAGTTLTIEVARDLARAAAKLGASADLARTVLAARAKGPS